MEYKNIFNFNIKWNSKTTTLFLALLVLPNYLGILQSVNILGFKIHFFQIAIFLAAMLYGPLGGAMSGAVGSIYVAIALHNPYIILGNIILGLFTGLFFRAGIHLVLAAFFAYLIQLPWLYLSDVYLADMPIQIVQIVIVSLLISNIIWSFVANSIGKRMKEFL